MKVNLTNCKKITLEATSEEEEEMLAVFAKRLENEDLVKILSVNEDGKQALSKEQFEKKHRQSISAHDASMLGLIARAKSKIDAKRLLGYLSKESLEAGKLLLGEHHVR